MPSHEVFMSGFNAEHQHHNYQLTNHLGSGGFSEVYQANDLARNNDPVAIKFFELRNYTSMGEEQLASFSKEANRIRSLHHPNIVEVRWHGTHTHEDRQYPYLVMEHVNGGTLRSRREMHGGRLPVEETVSLLGQVMLGIAHAHDKKIVHRDLKPDNILIANDKEVTQISGFPDMTSYGMAKVTDFGAAGVAHTNEHTVTKDQSIIGTFAYMAPEHFKGQAVTASDVYAMAIILYEQLSGQRPIGRNSMDGIQWHVAHELQSPLPLEEIMADKMNRLLEAIQPVIMRGLAKSVGDRYLTMTDFFEDFSEQVRQGTAAHAQTTIDMAAIATTTTAAIASLPEGAPADGITHLSTHMHTKQSKTPDFHSVPGAVSRRKLLLGAGGLLIAGSAWGAYNFLNDARQEQERQAVAGIAKDVISKLRDAGEHDKVYQLMPYLVPYDIDFVAKDISGLASGGPLALEKGSHTVNQMCFYAPDTAAKQIRAWMESGYVQIIGLAATPFAAIARDPDNPYAKSAQDIRDSVIEYLGRQNFWTAYNMMYAVNQDDAGKNPVTGTMVSGQEIWQSLVDDSAYSYDRLNAISASATAHNSNLLTKYAETYASWIKKTDPGGITIDVFRQAYAGLARVNQGVVKKQIENLTNSVYGVSGSVADELATALAIELAPYDPDAIISYVSNRRHVEQASGLAAISLSSLRPEITQEIAKTASEPLASWLRLALDPTDANLSKSTLSKLTDDSAHFIQYGGVYMAALLSSRIKPIL